MTHALPVFLPAFTAALQSALPGVQVVDGPPLDYAHLEYVAVGLTTEEVPTESGTSRAGLRATREQVDVLSEIRVGSGDPALSVHRDRAYLFLDTINTVLAGDPTVGDTVACARLIGHTYMALRDSTGTAVFLEPRIRVDHFPT